MPLLRDLPARPRIAAPTPRYPARHLFLGAVAMVTTAAACTPNSFGGDVAEPFGGAAPTSTTTGGAGGGGGGLGGGGGAIIITTTASGGAGGATTTSSSDPRWDGGVATGGADGGT
jgi:hypothetical protein